MPQLIKPVTAMSIPELLAGTNGQIRIACDTEFEGPHTLTSQFAMRIGDRIAVQIYHSPSIPPPPPGFNVKGLRSRLENWCSGVILRPAKPITADLSPARVLANLLNIPDFATIQRSNATESNQGQRADPITITFVAHFLQADFFRMFGSEYYTNLLLAQNQLERRINVQPAKLLTFREVGPGASPFAAPVIEYLGVGGDLYSIRARTFDTNLPFGMTRLDDHAQTFLGISKLEEISNAEKSRMLETFRTKPLAAYTYATLDAVITLLVEEQMRATDRRLYLSLGFTEGNIPVMRATQGARVVDMITTKIATTSAAGSVRLSRTGKPLKDGGVGKVAMTKVKKLMHKGSSKFIAEERLSRFGTQTGDTHGGLLFSRSPTQFFHAAPGQLRDVDLAGCYASIIGGTKVYVGRPVEIEPGSMQMKLADAVAYVERHAAGRDGWFIKVTGSIRKSPNTLIPSTNNALTNANFQSRRAKQRARVSRFGQNLDGPHASSKKAGHATLYTDVIESGIVAWPTWLMIKAMPARLRAEYERLEVDTILFYPAKLVAKTPAEFDALIGQYEQDQTDWSARLDMDRMMKIVKERIDHDYVSLEFNVGELAWKIGELRRVAREKHGRGSSEELALKLQANSIYGILASPYLVTNNVVAANVITATARALAFAMQMSLNGIQVITDGCTYRRDQIPACTFAECLGASPEFPIRRIEDGIPFVNPAMVPADGPEFTSWYRKRVMAFFNVSGPEYEELFGIHTLEHKRFGDADEAAFDGLCCDGSANNLKLMKTDNGWHVAEFKARAFNKDAKRLLEPWIVNTYISDCYTGPPPVTEMINLLSYKDALRTARRAANETACIDPFDDGAGPNRVLFPIGYDARRVATYKVIKPSAFLFRNPAQRAKFCKANDKFVDDYACGLELLALRRGHQDRRKGSICEIADRLYQYIRRGGADFSKALNLTRTCSEFKAVRLSHAARARDRKAELRKALFEIISYPKLQEDARLTGLVVDASNIHLLKSSGDGE